MTNPDDEIRAHDVADLLHGAPSADRVYELHDEDRLEADRLIYRLGLESRLVPGMPEQLSVAGVLAQVTRGPILVQRTQLRQRHGFPPQFDKVLRREEVGAGRTLLLLSIETLLSDPLNIALLELRSRAEAAAGVLTAVLDERIAGPQLFEDAVLMAGDEVLGAADLHASVRRLLPFDVTASDRHALKSLATVDFEDDPLLARAARVYRRAVAEGPTPDAFADLWIAVEALSNSRQPRRPELEKVFVDAGIDPQGLPVHVGLLIDLRGKVVHEGAEDHQERLRVGFYEMESLTRLMLRRRAGAGSLGWFPAHDPSAYAAPFDAAVGEWARPHETHWHEVELPGEPPPGPERFPRRIGRPDHDPRLQLFNAPQPEADFVTGVLVTAIEWFDPQTERLTVSVEAHEGPGPIAINADLIKIRPEMLEGLLDEERPERLINLVWELSSAVAIARVMASGVASTAETAWLLDAVGAAFQYDMLVKNGEFEADLINVEQPLEGSGLGKIVGWAAAGDARALAVLASRPPVIRAMADEFARLLVFSPPWPPRFATGEN